MIRKIADWGSYKGQHGMGCNDLSFGKLPSCEFACITEK
jgi:hypothetical protein